MFERLGWVWHLTAGGRLIRTTGEHPFYEVSRGWVACEELAAGDRLLCEDGTTVAVEEVVDTGAWEMVYNLRVSDWHTYFVSNDDWGFSVWSHNTPCNHDPAYAGFGQPVEALRNIVICARVEQYNSVRAVPSSTNLILVEY